MQIANIILQLHAHQDSIVKLPKAAKFSARVDSRRLLSFQHVLTVDSSRQLLSFRPVLTCSRSKLSFQHVLTSSRSKLSFQPECCSQESGGGLLCHQPASCFKGFQPTVTLFTFGPRKVVGTCKLDLLDLKLIAYDMTIHLVNQQANDYHHCYYNNNNHHYYCY